MTHDTLTHSSQAVESPPRTLSYRAYRLGGSTQTVSPAIALDIGDPTSLDEAKAAISAGHKDTVFIHEVDEARGVRTLHAFRIRAGKRIYRRNPVSGLSEPYQPLNPDHLFSLPVDAFEPTRPFDAFRDSASGVDRTLVEGSEV